MAIDPDPNNDRYTIVDYQFALSNGTIHTVRLPMDAGIPYSQTQPAPAPLLIDSDENEDEAFHIFTPGSSSGSTLSLSRESAGGQISFALEDDLREPTHNATTSLLPGELTTIEIPDFQIAELSEEEEVVQMVAWSQETEASLRQEEHNIFTTSVEHEDTTFSLAEDEPLTMTPYTLPMETKSNSDTLRSSRQLPFTVVDTSERVRPFITSSSASASTPATSPSPFMSIDTPLLHEINRPKIAPTVTQAQTEVPDERDDIAQDLDDDELAAKKKSSVDWKSLALFGGIGVLFLGGGGYYLLGGGSSSSTQSSSTQSSVAKTTPKVSSTPTTQIVRTPTTSLTAFCTASHAYPSLSLTTATTPQQAQSEFTQASTAIASMLKTAPAAVKPTVLSMQSNLTTISSLLQGNAWNYATLPQSNGASIIAASTALNTDSTTLDTTLSQC